MTRLFWRLLPIFIILYTMQGTVAQYAQFLTVAKHASRYTMTYIHLSSYVPALQDHYEEYQDFPTDLAKFLRAHFTAKGHDTSLDYWDNPYRLMEARDHFTLKSCGMDRACPTDDDLSQSAPKASPASKGEP